MEQRVKNLEDLCELITKEVVEQNKNMIEMNKNLINEIRCLREAYVKQDDDFEEFKNLLRKIYELNRQVTNIPFNIYGLSQNFSTLNINQFKSSLNNLMPPMFPPMPPMPPQQQQPGQQHPPSTQQLTSNLPNYPINTSLINEPVNQSMMNNLSFLSVQTPLHQNQATSLANLNITGSLPPSASAMNPNIVKQIQPAVPPQQISYQELNQQQIQPPIVKPTVNVVVPPYNPAQPPPSIFNKPPVVQPQQQSLTQMNQLQTQPQQMQPQVQQIKAPFSFAPITNTTSTPQTNQFSFKQSSHIQSTNQSAEKPKPPIFDLSPTKPLTDSTNKEMPKQQPPSQSQLTQVQSMKPTIQASVNNNLFSGVNLFKSVEPNKPSTNNQPANNPPSTLGGLFQFGNTQQPPVNLFKAPQPTTLGALLTGQAQGNEEGHDDNEDHQTGNPEEYEPQVEFKPLVQLKEVEVKTGEEDEDILIKLRSKIYRFDSETKEWKEKGVGELKLLKHKQTKAIRLLMRRDQVFKLCANHRINGDMKLTEISPKQLSWMAIDFSENEGKSELLLAKFRTPEEANQFKAEFEKAVQAMKIIDQSPHKPISTVTKPVASDKPSLSQQFKSDQWKCNACYAPNKKDDLKCACCATPKPGSNNVQESPKTNILPGGLQAKQNTQDSKPFGFETKPFSFGINSSQQQTNNNNKPPFSFGTTQQQSPGQAPKFDFSAKENIFKSSTPSSTAVTTPGKTLPFSFGPLSQSANSQTAPVSNQQVSEKPKDTPSTGLFGAPANTVLFDKASLPSFASLASKNPSGNIFANPGTTDTAGFKPIGFSGGLQPSTQIPKPLFGGSVPAPSNEKEDGGDEAENDNQNPEEYEPQVDFKPLVKLQEVEVKTGEENEDAVFKQRCKLYRYDSSTKEWKEKGTGEIKVLKHKLNNNMYRILMRRDQVLKLCANHRITSDIKLEIFNEKQVRWHAQDFSEGEGKHELLAARFKHEDDAKKFKQSIEDAQKVIASEPKSTTENNQEPKKEETKSICDGLKPSLSELFKKDNAWTCKDCYVTNKDDAFKCVACQSVRKDTNGNPMTKPETTTTGIQNQTQTQGKFPFGLKSTTQNHGPISFTQTFGQTNTSSTAQDSNTTSLFKTPAASSMFGGSNQQSSTITSLFPKPTETTAENVFGTKAGLSFADLAKNTPQSGFGGGFIGQGANLFSNNKPAMLFGAQTAKPGGNEEDGEEVGENQNPEEYEPQVDFKPLVKLQEVEVKTGEEDEEVLFKQRCKLYRFSNQTVEWKEKGTGDIKILKHKYKENTYRILMRRDQVLKLCANHRISPEMKIEVVNEKQLRWLANDCSEGEPHTELLAVKFRHEEDAKKFKEEFEKAQQQTKNNPTKTNGTPSQSVNNENKVQNSLSSLIKTESGSWNCSACYTPNKPNVVKCVCCEAEKPKSDLATKLDDNEIQVVFTAKPTDEQIEKARSLKLPDNFYLYLKKPNCNGCPGCENEE